MRHDIARAEGRDPDTGDQTGTPDIREADDNGNDGPPPAEPTAKSLLDDDDPSTSKDENGNPLTDGTDDGSAPADGEDGPDPDANCIGLEEKAEKNFAAPRTLVGSHMRNLYSRSRDLDGDAVMFEGINRFFIQDAPVGANVNCVSCTLAAFYRFTGRYPNALAENSEDYADFTDLLLAFIYGTRPNMTPESVKQELLDGGDGTVAAVIIKIQEEGRLGYFHAIFAYNRGRAVTFIDPQAGKIVELRDDLSLRAGIMYESDYKDAP